MNKQFKERLSELLELAKAEREKLIEKINRLKPVGELYNNLDKFIKIGKNILEYNIQGDKNGNV